MSSATRLILGGLLSLAMASLSISASAQSREMFKARLSAVPVDLAMTAAIGGSGTVTAELNGETLSIAGTFEGLRSPATAARLYRGPAKGVRGPAVFDLTIAKAVSGTIQGTFRMPAAQIESLKRAQFYIQLDSENAPGGNLWGWIVREPR